MTTIDLGAAPPEPPPHGLHALPRRVTLTLPELRLAAEHAGGAPLPFDVVAPGGGTSTLESRLGASRGTSEDQAYLRTLDALHDPEGSLTRRGLLAGGTLDEGVAGAVGLLATPAVAVDLDVTVPGVQVRAWHRQDGDAVATLATGDGLVFELAWLHQSAWPDELARVVALPDDVEPRGSAVPGSLEMPYELADAAAEALVTGRGDLLDLLAAEHDGAVTGPDGEPLPAADLVPVLHGLVTETQGRLRVLVADVSEEPTTVVGVRSWVLLADGWRSIRPSSGGDRARVEITSVAAGDLAADLAPVLAEVTS